MYVPQAFEEKRVPVIHQLMEAHPFATFITWGSSGLVASHIPMLLERGGSELGVLKAHVSRANAQWREICSDVEALAIFGGPHHYITPTWYLEKAQTGKVVPTWNYAVVHAYGRVKLIQDTKWLHEHVGALTDIHEAEKAMPWRLADAPREYVDAMLNGIVGLEMMVTRLEGKWKQARTGLQGTGLGQLRG